MRLTREIYTCLKHLRKNVFRYIRPINIAQPSPTIELAVPLSDTVWIMITKKTIKKMIISNSAKVRTDVSSHSWLQQ